jgi:hypothetical protein
MTTITLELPDDLAAQLKAYPVDLSELIQEALKSKLGNWPQTPSGSGATPPIYQEITNFLASNPTLQEIHDFKISAVAQEHLEGLLDKNREDGLTPEENGEVEKYLQYSHVMTLLKASARRVLYAHPE